MQWNESPFARPADKGLKKGFIDGTHRLFDPEVTLKRIQPFLAVCGITRVANVTGLDRIGVPVVMVCRPNSRSVAVSQGKGLTLNAARASGIMEAIELHRAENIASSLSLGSERELVRSGALIATERLPKRRHSRFTPCLPILWIEGLELISGGRIWLPYECVSMNATLPFPSGSGCFLATSNGLASGNCPMEAVSHAICEIVERDSTALWRASGGENSTERLVDLSTVDDQACLEVLTKCNSAGVGALVWDITSDVRLPAFAALITEDRQACPLSATAIGYGCHVEKGIALLRALTEAVQSRLTFISGARDDLFRAEYEDSPNVRAKVQSFVNMLGSKPTHRFEDIVSRKHFSFDEDVTYELECLTAIGINQIAVLTLNHEGDPFSVVRVVIPGLEGPDSDAEYVRGERAIQIAGSAS